MGHHPPLFRFFAPLLRQTVPANNSEDLVMSPGDPISPDSRPLGPVIETPRLILRRPVRADAARLAELANDPVVAENLSTLPHPYGLDDALSYVDNTEVGPARWNLGVHLKGETTSEFIGTVSLMPREGERFFLGYWIGRPYWGKGLAAEAAQALVDYAFAALDADAVAATTRVTNAQSRRVLEKCGFQYCGQGMGPSLYFRGMVPIDRFRLDRSTWHSLKKWANAAVAPSTP
jgi:RimJ/RimL family protein N-acetyltransferase